MHGDSRFNYRMECTDARLLQFSSCQILGVTVHLEALYLYQHLIDGHDVGKLGIGIRQTETLKRWISNAV